MAKKLLLSAALAFGLLATTAQYAQAMDKTDRTIVGVGIGLLGGAILSNGDPWATIAGGAVGGTIGNVTADNRRRDDRRYGNRHGDPYGRGYPNGDYRDARHDRPYPPPRRY